MHGEVSGCIDRQGDVIVCVDCTQKVGHISAVCYYLTLNK